MKKSNPALSAVCGVFGLLLVFAGIMGISNTSFGELIFYFAGGFALIAIAIKH